MEAAVAAAGGGAAFEETLACTLLRVRSETLFGTSLVL